MKKLQFDERGFLPSESILEISVEEFEAFFVDSFPNSTTRKPLFQNWLRFINDFQRDVFPYFEQWINGSFVSKKLNPNDLDFVTLLDGGIFDRRDKSGILNQFLSFSLEKEGLDAYLLPVYEKNHPDFERTLMLKKRFEQLYSSTPVDVFGRQIEKGFVKIIFEKEIN